MNTQVDNTEYEFLWQLLANPADNNHSHIFNLQLLVKDYPHSGLLHALLMPNGDKQNIKHAAAYFNPATLHKLATATDTLPVVTAEQIILIDRPTVVAAQNATHYHLPEAETFVAPVMEETPAAEHHPVEEEDPYTNYTELTNAEVVEEATTPAEAQAEAIPATGNSFAEKDPETIQHEELAGVYNTFSEPQPVAETYPEDEDEAAVAAYTAAHPTPIATEVTAAQPQITTSAPIEEANALAKEFNEYQAKHNLESSGPVYTFDEVNYFHQDIEDEVYDEIVSIEDIGLEQLAILDANKSTEEKEESPVQNDNYFVFEPAPAEEHTPPVNTNVIAQVNDEATADANNEVSKYDDDKLPYSFLWWLDKTRKEHAKVNQPYTNKKAPAKRKKKQIADELQQQYYENIISVNSIDGFDKVASATTDAPAGKLDKIVERFMYDAPQIKHPSGVKLDTENKAKKSAEDKDEFVTETLARIYAEQMLYHKAILTYKKLMLKFPEKSLYFAGQIEQLESKIN